MGKTEATFKNNNFAHTGEKDGGHVTLLENNYASPFRPNTYEATFVFLIRQQGELTIHTDHQVLGLFSQATWEKVFDDSELTMQSAVIHLLMRASFYSPYTPAKLITQTY